MKIEMKQCYADVKLQASARESLLVYSIYCIMGNRMYTVFKVGFEMFIHYGLIHGGV